MSCAYVESCEVVRGSSVQAYVGPVSSPTKHGEYSASEHDRTQVTHNDTVMSETGILGDDAGPAVPAGAGVVEVDRDVRGGFVDGDRRSDGEERVHGSVGGVRQGMRARARSVAGTAKPKEAGPERQSGGQGTQKLVNDFAVNPLLPYRIYMRSSPALATVGAPAALRGPRRPIVQPVPSVSAPPHACTAHRTRQ